MALEIKNLKVEVEDQLIVKGIDLTVKPGEIHALMGRNGSGKTTLAKALMGHPKYTIVEGQIILDGEDITELSPDERAKKGLFMSFQYPVEIPGVNFANFLRQAYRSIHEDEKREKVPTPQEEMLEALKFRNMLKSKLKLVDLPESFLDRYLNEGFSGGEKKRAEILQLAVLQPKYAILDETDSGLDIDALKIVANAIKQMADETRGYLIITHYQRILSYIEPDYVHVMMNGKIVKSGGKDLAHELEKHGYSWIEKEISQ